MKTPKELLDTFCLEGKITEKHANEILELIEIRDKKIKKEYVLRGKREFILLADSCEKKGWDLDKFITGLFLIEPKLGEKK